MSEGGSKRGATPGSGRSAAMLATVVISVSVIGFVVGTRPANSDGDDPVVPPAAHDLAFEAHPSDATPAPSYVAMRETRIGPNRNWIGQVTALAATSTEPGDRELAARQDNRAYDGAPPRGHASNDNCHRAAGYDNRCRSARR